MPRTPVIGRVRRSLLLVSAGVFGAAAFLLYVPSPATGQTAEPTGLGHFVCYTSQAQSAFQTPPAVMLQNQFKTKGFLASTLRVGLHCNPVQKTLPSGAVSAVRSPSWHLLCWGINPNRTQEPRTVDVRNQFGQGRLTTSKPTSLCLPSLKSEATTNPTFKAPGANEIQPDHLSCYPARQVAGASSFKVPAFVGLKDQFGSARTKIGPPTLLCLPTGKTVDPAVGPTKINHSDSHLMCFAIAPDPAVSLPRTVYDRNQFGTGKVTAQRTNLLCLPSFKTLAR